MLGKVHLLHRLSGKTEGPISKMAHSVLSRFGPGLCAEGSSPGLSLYGLLGLLYGMVGEFQEQASHEQQTEAVSPFMT